MQYNVHLQHPNSNHRTFSRVSCGSTASFKITGKLAQVSFIPSLNFRLLYFQKKGYLFNSPFPSSIVLWCQLPLQ